MFNLSGPNFGDGWGESYSNCSSEMKLIDLNWSKSDLRSQKVSYRCNLCLREDTVATRPQECLYHSVITTRQGPFNAKGGVLFRINRKRVGRGTTREKTKIIHVAP